MKFFILALFFIPQTLFAAPERISSIYKDLGRVEKIYLYPGLISVIEFPQDLLEVRVGNPKSVKVEISQVSPRELTLFLLGSAVNPTNLIVRSNQKLYVFDIIPSKVSHQDYVQIKNFYGAPGKERSIKPKNSKTDVNPQKLLYSEILGGR